MGLYRDNGKENGKYYSRLGNILGSYRDNRKMEKYIREYVVVIWG